MSDNKHAVRSPSGADWWGRCPGGPALVESLNLPPRPPGPAAEWGTMCHGLGETGIKFVLGRGNAPLFPTKDDEAKEVVDFYTNQVFAPDEPLCDCSPKSWVVGVEERGGSKYLEHSSGTRDFVAYCPVHRWLRVVDLKTGHNEVEALENWQGAIYALHDLMSGKYIVSRVIIEIVQPRSPSGRKVKRWELSPLELLEWLPVFIRKVEASMAPNAPLVAGEKQCKYCPAAPVCPERRKGVTRAAQLQFGITDRSYRHPPEDIAEALVLVPQLKDWIKSVEAYAYQMANNGMVIPGFKLVQKRDGNRKWTDEEAAFKFFEALAPQVSRSMYVESKLIGPAQADKILGKEKTNELCTREPGGTVLVEDSDNRPAVVVDKLATFQHLLTK